MTRTGQVAATGRLILLAVFAGACATAPAPSSDPGPVGVRTQPNEVHWVRRAAEHRAIFIQTFGHATERVRALAANRPRGGWAVILDADETVLDNSEYQRRLAERGGSFDIETWNAWVREEAADTLPGAAAFIRTVRELGGRVAIVTNRDDVVCDSTRRNLRDLGVTVDVVLCQTAGESGKGGRFRAVAEGTAGAGLPQLDVIAFVGDNIQDFPSTTQQIRDAGPAAFGRFGHDWFILPNPMYGSWERVPPR
ncbi:N/A [soil metagenome]